MVKHPLLGQCLLIMEALQPHSAGLWVSDQLDTETSVTDNTQHSQQTYIHASGRIQTCDPSKWAATDSCLQSRGHWDWHSHSNTHIRWEEKEL